MKNDKYWANRAAKLMYGFMDEAEDEADSISKIYQRASGWLNIEAEEIFERFRVKHGLSEKEARRLLSKIRDKEDLRIAQLRAIAEAADYDINKVQKAYEITLQTPTIDDFVAFMIAAIKNSYEKPDKRKKTPKRTEDAFRNFEERTYDYSKIEEQFAKN